MAVRRAAGGRMTVEADGAQRRMAIWTAPKDASITAKVSPIRESMV